MGQMRDADWSRETLLRSDWLVPIVAPITTAFGLPLSFLPSKTSFLHDHSTTQHSDFSSFLAISTTDEPVNHAAERFCVKGIYLS